MDIRQIIANEKYNSGTSPTNNKQFDKEGYLVIPNLTDPKELYAEVPDLRGQMHYWGDKEHEFNYVPDEQQVSGSLARYNVPEYRQIHLQIKTKLEEVIGKKLFPTYFYDRFYFAGQELTMHTDRDACEISVSVHISSNTDKEWPFKIRTCEGMEGSANLKPGDGLLYKGCERPHWREPLESRYGKWKTKWRKFRKKEDDTYYHQVFFHYVLANGQRQHCAYDRAK